MSVHEAAALLETTARNIRRWVAEGKLPAIDDPNGGRGRVVPSEAAHALKLERDTGDGSGARGTSGRTDKDTNKSRPSVRPLESEEAQLLEHLKREVDFLRARNSELNAVVMQQARALASQSQERPAIEAAPVTATPGTSAEPEPVKTGAPLTYNDIADQLERDLKARGL